MDASGFVCTLAGTLFCAGFINAQSPFTPAASQQNRKLSSTYQVLRFPNQDCVGSTNKSGICYTSSECASKGGVNAGSCALGYGVCCILTVHCGSTSSQNCTYFESTGGESETCAVNICKINSIICQLRLDFTTFVITGPSTLTTTECMEEPVKGHSDEEIKLAACLTDSFSVTNPGGRAPPSICGINTGYHMYVDASPDCNQLAFELGKTAIGSAIANRQWSIRITQYGCDHKNLAPKDCTQFLYGNNANCVYTFNYAGGVMLSSQDQNICVRICWHTETEKNINDVETSRTVCSSAQPFILRLVTDGFELLTETGLRRGTKACYVQSDTDC